MFERVTLHASDREASRGFYETVLPTLGVQPVRAGEWADFALVQAAGDAVTRRLHIAFTAPTRDHVRAFWEAGTAAGYADDGEPGPRPVYGTDYFGGFLLDPDGNSAEAVHLDLERPAGRIDHLWIRVADVAAARAFYAPLAERAGLRIGADEPERLQLRGADGSFSLVAGTPTAHVDMALPAAADAALRDPDGNVVELVRRAA
jgi:catechol 2,3-dioxygenase-like lactoylglutathione lyase family enzyme